MPVSASSAGPAVHLVLAEQVSSTRSGAVVAWGNVAGLVGGTPLIEHAARRFSWWSGS